MSDSRGSEHFRGVTVKRESPPSPSSSFPFAQAGPSTSSTNQPAVHSSHATQAPIIGPSQLTPSHATVPLEIFKGLKLIHECGIKLQASRQTIATTFVIYHKFFTSIGEKHFHSEMVAVQDLIAATCYYISTKIPGEESSSLKLRDIITVFYDIAHPNSDPLDPQVKDREEYSLLVESITHLELVIGRYINLRVKIQHPHPYLLNFNRTLNATSNSDKVKKIVFSRASWAVMNDFYFSPSCIKYPPKYVALAVIEFTRKFCPLSLIEEDVNLREELLSPPVNEPLISQIMGEIQFCYSWLRKNKCADENC